MNEDCQRKYELNSYSKEQILKVSSYITYVHGLTIFLSQIYSHESTYLAKKLKYLREITLKYKSNKYYY